MKKWIVSDIRWANGRDLDLPLWKEWNKQNPLPDNFWQRIWEYPYLYSKIPSDSKSLDIGGTYPFVLFKNYPNAVSVDNRNLNRLKHPLHLGKWPKNKLIICDAAKIPARNNSFDYAFSISSIEEMPHTLEVLKEMIRIAKYRVVVTMDISDELGVPIKKLRDLEKFLNIKIPPLPSDSLNSCSRILKKFRQKQTLELKSIRVLGITIDSRDAPRSVGILIPHWESYNFLKQCIDSIRQNKNKNLKEKIYILDDASNDGSFEKAKNYFREDKNIEFHRFERPNKNAEADVGLLLDYGVKLVREQYTAMIDADLFPLSEDWLAFPIWLLEEYNCSSVGLDTGLSTGYLNRIPNKVWWQPNKGYIPSGGLYDNEWFSCTNNLYRVMPTSLAKIVSQNVGFTRARSMIKNDLLSKVIQKLKRYPPFSMIYPKILQYAPNLQRLENKRYPYLPGGEDNGVAANHFIDINYLGPKFNIPLTSYIGLTPKDGAFGQNISGLAFHFALSTRALSSTRREIRNAGKSFKYWVNQIQTYDGINKQNIKKMIESSRHFRAGGYDGSIPRSWYEKEFKFMQNLLKRYKSRK